MNKKIETQHKSQRPYKFWKMLGHNSRFEKLDEVIRKMLQPDEIFFN